ncbi:UNVERIFIED_CONTAM: putative lysine-specific demethylase [Sesamum radiatum]|uniref:Lysine-specific demethylase n=1 Tax=Sesamum radiatum TaxID=300843 RepID=A0AAW2K013_SESRA
MDQNRVCSDYWKSRPLMQIPQQSHYVESNSNSYLKSEPLNDEETRKSHPGVDKILSGLFKKANPEELQTLYSLLHNKNSTLARLLSEEINRHPKIEFPA